MSWKDRLQTASFREVSFLVESHQTSGGRRVAVHEYPFADDPDPEDMGLKAHEFSFNAYFIGQDYDIAAAKLEQALDQKGSGLLTLPLSGQQDVQLLTWQRSESTKEGGIARFTLKFIQAGKQKFPQREINVKAAVLQTQKALTQRIEDDFQENLKSWLDERTSAAFEIAQQLSKIGRIFNRLQNLTRHEESISAIQTAIAEELPALPEAWSNDIAPSPQLTETVNQQVQQQQILFDAIAVSIEPPYLLLATAQIQVVETAVRLANQAFISYQQAQTIQQQLNSMITRVTEYPALRENYDDQMIGIWSDLRVQIDQSIQQQLLVLPKIKHIDINHELPAVVIAHRLYGDAKQADAFAAQNEINHPAFCSGTLEYLSSK